MTSPPPERRPLRVLRVITRLNVGGPALQAILLTERLDPELFETLLVTGEADPAEGEMLTLRPSRVRPTVVPGLARDISMAADLMTLLRVARIMRAFRPDVVHTHMAKAGLLGRVAARLAGVPIVVHTFHGNVLRGYFGPVRSRFFLALERILARASTRIIAISPLQMAELRELGVGSERKLIEIPLGVELRPFLDPPRGRLRAELGLDTDVPLVGIVGRLVPIKRVDLFVEAMAILATKVRRIRFAIVGDGESAPSIRALVRERGLDDRSSFLGWRADLAAIYGDLDVLVITSDSEGTPVSVIEALAAARPVVGTAVGGVPDLLSGGAGILVPPRDPRAVADAVERLIASPDRAAALGATGRARAFPAYDISTLVERIERLYLELARQERLAIGFAAGSVQDLSS